MKILRARLYELELPEAGGEAARPSRKGKKEIGFGSQIRSYVLHPYRMVKDHRTTCEVGNTDAVLDGDLDKFIEAYLLPSAWRNAPRRPPETDQSSAAAMAAIGATPPRRGVRMSGGARRTRCRGGASS